MPQAIYILFGAAFTALVSLSLGKLLSRGLSLRLYRQEEHFLAFVTGSAVLSLVIFFLCAIGAARKGVFLIVGIVIITVAVRRRAHRPAGEGLPALYPFWRWLFAAVFSLYFILYFFNAMAPEISPDGGTYHLGLVSRYLREHGFHRITTNMYANVSQGVEMLFLFAFAFGRHSAAALVHFTFLVVLALTMVCYGRRSGFGPAGACGALFTFASPVLGIDGTSAYNDVAVACIVFALFYFLQIWDKERDQALLIPVGLLAGFGYATKYTAFLALPYALGFVGWKTFRSRNRILKPLAIVALSAAVLMIPWITKNWIWLGNPFSPFFNSLFPNPYIHVSFEQSYAEFFRMYELTSRWQIPLAVTMSGTLSGLLGPVFLLAPLGLYALRWPAGRQLLLASLIFGITYPANIGTRFLIPAIPFISLAIALAFSGSKGVAPIVLFAHALLSWPPIVTLYCAPTAWRLVDIPVRQALRIVPEEAFLIAEKPDYAVARLIERVVPARSKVFAWGTVPEAYTSREILTSFQSASNEVLRDILLTPIIPDFAPTWRLRFRFPPQQLRRVRIVQTARDHSDQWSVAEFRVLREEQELPRATEWRLRAKPNPWGVQLAFDNSPVTRWRSWQSLSPGMFLEVDFSRNETIDSVLLESSHDQYKIQLKIEGQNAEGKWQSLGGEAERYDAPPPTGMRRAAIQELKSSGVGYLVVTSSDFAAEDFRTNSALWGISLLGESNETRIYKIL